MLMTPLFPAAANEHNLPAELLRAVIRRESGFNHRSAGKAGEIGPDAGHSRRRGPIS